MKATLGQVIIYVEDMKAQAAFYRDTLGLKVTWPENEANYENWVTFDTGACTLALHSGGKRRIGEDAAKFVFFVDDINAARAELMERGVEMGEVFVPIPGVQVANAHDPEGNEFSIESHG